MAHDPKVVATQQITNEFVAYRIVCCGEACSDKCKPHAHVCEDSWHTLSIHVPDHDAKLEERKKEVADRHEKIVQWRAKHGK